MNADTRMAASLVLSLIVSSTNLRLAMAGRADIVTVGVRYVIGFVICFVLVGIVGRLFHVYLANLDEAHDEGTDAQTVGPAEGDVTATA